MIKISYNRLIRHSGELLYRSGTVFRYRFISRAYVIAEINDGYRWIFKQVFASNSPDRGWRNLPKNPSYHLLRLHRESHCFQSRTSYGRLLHPLSNVPKSNERCPSWCSVRFTVSRNFKKLRVTTTWSTGDSEREFTRGFTTHRATSIRCFRLVCN